MVSVYFDFLMPFGLILCVGADVSPYQLSLQMHIGLRAKTSGSIGSFHSHPYLPVESGERMGAVPLASWRGLLPAPAKGLKGWSRAATDGSLGAAARTLGAKPT